MYSLPNRKRMRQLSTSEKLDAVKRIHSGESKASVARHIDVPESTLRGWCKNEQKLRYNADKLDVDGLSQPKQTKVTNMNIDYVDSSRRPIDLSNSGKSLGATRPNYESSNYHLNSIAQFGNQPNLTMFNKLTESPNNGFIVPYYAAKQNSGNGLDMIDNLKRPVATSLSNGTTVDQDTFIRNNLYLAMQARVFPHIPPTHQQQQAQTMMPSSMFTTPPPPSISQPTSTIPLDNKGDSYYMWQKYNQSLIAMMGDKSPRTSNSRDNNNYNKNLNGRVTEPKKTQTEYTIRSLSLSSSSSSSSPMPDGSENQRRPPLDDFLNNNNVVVENGSDDMKGLPEAVENAEKFYKWFETYSDPTITSQDFLQFERLLCKVRKIAERVNQPVLKSSKRSRK